MKRSWLKRTMGSAKHCGLWALAAITGLAAVLVASGCEQDARPVIEETPGQSSLALTNVSQTAPALTLPVNANAQYKESDDGGASFSSLDVAFVANGGLVDVDVSMGALGSLFGSSLNLDGSQPSSDAFISPLTLYLDTLPHKSASLALGDAWETQVPAGWIAKIEADKQLDIASYHAERVVTAEDIYLLSPDLAVLRVSFEEYVARTSTPALEAAGILSGRTHIQRLGVADVVVGLAGSFNGRYLPIRVAAITADPIGPIAPGTSYADLAAGAHVSALSCAVSVTGLPSVAVDVIPSGGHLPVPALFAQCP